MTHPLQELEVKRGLKVLVEKEVFNLKRTMDGQLLVETTDGQVHKIENCYLREETE